MNIVWTIVYAIVLAVFVFDSVMGMMPPYVVLGAVMLFVMLIRIDQALRKN